MLKACFPRSLSFPLNAHKTPSNIDFRESLATSYRKHTEMSFYSASCAMNAARQTTLLQCCASAFDWSTKKKRSKIVHNKPFATNVATFFLRCEFYECKKSQNVETQITCYTVATSILLVRMPHRAGPTVSGNYEVSLQTQTLPGACFTVDSFKELEENICSNSFICRILIWWCIQITLV